MSAPCSAKILVVDDDDVVRQSFRRHLVDGGYEVFEAMDGVQALEQVGGVDLLILDLRMPRMDGLEALRQIRQSRPGMPVIVVSGAGATADVVAALRLGALDYLLKPLDDLAILDHAVDRAMEITQMRREREAYQRRLEEQVRLRTAELVKAHAAKDEFMAMVSHELRTPLTPVMLILNGAESDDRCPADLREDLAVACRHLELEARLIDDLLDVSRILSGKLELRKGECDVHEAIRLAVAVYHEQMGAKQLKLDLDLKAPRSRMIGDAGRLQQVFWNLLGNALKFTPAGRSVTVSSSNPTPETLMIQVQDTGIGMSADALARAFVRFEQADRSTTRKYGGLGIGLSICRAVVDLHGGMIEAASEGTGRGSTFTIRLPLSADSGTQQP